MAATVTTKEVFPSGTSEEVLKSEIQLRLKAGAIRSWFEKTEGLFNLYTEWNVIGEQ